MTTETLDKLYLEWSQFTEARTERELRYSAALLRIAKAVDPDGIAFDGWATVLDTNAKLHAIVRTVEKRFSTPC